MKKIASFYVVTALLISFPISARHIKVVIASENNHKIAATKSAFSEVFPSDSIEYVTYKSQSGIPEQPVKKKNALRGARNRIKELPEQLIQGADFAIAIENYITPSKSGSTWFDIGLIVLKDLTTGVEAITKTQATPIPENLVQTAQQMSGSAATEQGYPITIGSVIQQQSQGAIDGHDWHRDETYGGVSRVKLMHDAICKALHANDIAFMKSTLGKYPDFPKPGILFIDFWPLIANAQAFQTCIDLLAEHYKARNISVIVGLESRGFIVGTALAHKLGIGFVPVRKPGKLPGATYSVTYQKEYGTDTLVISQSALKPTDRVLIVDDLIATGGSARAAIDLVKQAHATPVEFISLLKVKELARQAKLNIPAFNLID